MAVMKRGMIFDLDSVLVSTDEYRCRSRARLCREEAFTFVDREVDQPEREGDHRCEYPRGRASHITDV